MLAKFAYTPGEQRGIHVDVELALGGVVVHPSLTIPSLGLSRVSSSGRAPPGADLGGGGRRRRARAAEGRVPRRLRDERRHAQREGASGRPPRELAAELAARIAEVDEVESTEVAGPGFINLRLADSFFVGALAEVGDGYGGGWAAGARARAGRDGVREPDRPARSCRTRGTARTATASRGCSRSAATRSSASTTTTTPVRRSTASGRRSTRCGAASRCRRTATTATTFATSPRRTAIRCRGCSRRSSARSSGSASTSTAGRCRASSSSGCPSSCRGSTPTRRTARCGRARPPTATSRTG